MTTYYEDDGIPQVLVEDEKQNAICIIDLVPHRCDCHGMQFTFCEIEEEDCMEVVFYPETLIIKTRG